MAMFWMIGSSLPSMQYLIELGEAKPSRFDFINNHSINVFRDKLLMEHRQERSQSYNGAPNGNRTRVFAVKGRRPRPLDDGRGPRRPSGAKRAQI